MHGRSRESWSATPGGKGTLMMQSDESNPDYALVSSIRLANGGEVLNVFGDRVQTGAYITRKLTDPAFAAEFERPRLRPQPARAPKRPDRVPGRLQP